LQKFGGFPIDLKHNVLKSMPVLIGFNLPKKNNPKLIKSVYIHPQKNRAKWPCFLERMIGRCLFIELPLIPTIPINPEPKSQIPNAKDLASPVSKNGYFRYETNLRIVTITYKHTNMAYLHKCLKNDSDHLFFFGNI